MKATLVAERALLRSQKDMAKLSRATVRVPTDGPNSRPEAMTNVSDTDNLADDEGTRTVKEPVISVSAARVSHSSPGGAFAVSQSAFARAKTPRTHTVVM